MKNINILILLFSTFCSIEGKSLERYSVNSDSNQIYLLNDDNIVVFNFKNEIIDTLLYHKNYKPELDKTEIAWINNVPHIVSIPGGMVWKLINDTFIRIDNSYAHQMTCGSDVFVHNDTILKFGGYGYWSNRNFFTYFDLQSRQWEFYKVNETYLPPGVATFSSVYSNGNYYFSGGNIVDNLDASRTNTNLSVWKFNFENKKWVNLGLSKHFDYSKESKLDLGNGRHLHESINGIYLTDYLNNFVKKIDTKLLFPLRESFFANDSIYSSVNHKIASFPLDIFLNNISSEKQFYLDSDALFIRLRYLSLTLIVILIFSVCLLQKRNRKRPRITKTGVKYAGVNHNLTDKELKILNAFVKHRSLDSKTVLMITNDSSRSEAQNNRIKLDTLSSLDSKLSDILGIDSFIKSKRSLRDKRLIIYHFQHKIIFLT